MSAYTFRSNRGDLAVVSSGDEQQARHDAMVQLWRQDRRAPAILPSRAGGNYAGHGLDLLSVEG